MTTITFNERTKVGKTLLEFVANNKGVKIDTNGLSELELTPKQKKWVKNLRQIAIDVKSGNYKGQSLQSFLDEL